MDAVEACGQSYAYRGDLRVCWLDYNHDGNCIDANQAASEERDADGWVF